MKTHHTLSAVILFALLLPAAHAASDTAPTVITLTQVPCQFLESEGSVNHGYRSKKAEDCVAINTASSAARLQKAEPLRLPPGKYVFRVTNKNVPYELGFWLRGKGVTGRLGLPSVSGGGLVEGKTQDYAIDLKPGDYVYSCPLNPTPDYPLVVK
jgi:hypothetical protein